jgi:hypothetical protein
MVLLLAGVRVLSRLLRQVRQDNVLFQPQGRPHGKLALEVVV